MNWHKSFLETAPRIVTCFAKNIGDDRKKNYYFQESCGIACGSFIAAIHGYSYADSKSMKFLGNILLHRSPNERAYMLFPVGYPAKNAMVPDLRRKNTEALITWKVQPDQ